MEERIAAARRLESAKTVCPIVVDLMNDSANYQYGGQPERLYIILDGQIVYKGDIGPMGYKLEEVQVWLDNYRKDKQQSNEN